MSTRKLAIGLTIALGAPLGALADGFWETTNDEAGSRIVVPQLGAFSGGSAPTAPTAPTALRVGALSPDRQYVFLGDEGGWQLRPMEYRFEFGRVVLLGDPVGYMHHVAGDSPITSPGRAEFEHSRGS